MKLEENYSLKLLNTFGVEAYSRYFYALQDLSELHALCGVYKPLVLGGGSNILFTQDYDGTVILNQLKGIDLLEETDKSVIVEVAAGENWHEFVCYALAQKWYGLEALSLIPGTVGASPIQNVGAYGVEVKSVIQKVKCFNLKTAQYETYLNADCQFDYRDSIFKHKQDEFIITSVVFMLSKKPVIDLTYGALKRWFADIDETSITPQEVANAVIAIRQEKLPNPAEIGNAGSFFKNPIIDKEHYERLQDDYANLIAYPIDNNDKVKLVAGQLIELAGFKGVYVNNVGMYEKQALILVNLGGATGNELVTHYRKVQAEIERCFKIKLEPEPLIL